MTDTGTDHLTLPLLSDGATGCLVGWTGPAGNGVIRVDDFAQPLPGWTTNGVSFAAYPNSHAPAMAHDGHGGAHLAWRQQVGVGGQGLFEERYVHVLADGSFQSATLGVSREGQGGGEQLRAWPMPARQDLKIYCVACEGEALRVFDISGRLIRSLAVTSGGATWDLREASGKQVPSGIYLLRTGTEGAALRVVVSR